MILSFYLFSVNKFKSLKSMHLRLSLTKCIFFFEVGSRLPDKFDSCIINQCSKSSIRMYSFFSPIRVEHRD